MNVGEFHGIGNTPFSFSLLVLNLRSAERASSLDGIAG